MKKILLIRLSSLGDIIFNIPLANVLKDNGYEVTWLVSEKGIDIVKDNPAVHKAILLPIQKWKKNKYSLGAFIDFLKVLREIRKEKFDIAIDTQMMFKSLLWMRLCRAKRKIVYNSGKEFSYLGGNERIEPASRANYATHAVFLHMQYAKYLNLEGTDRVKFTLPPSSDETKAKMDELLKDVDKSKPVVVICPATTWKLKHWNKDNWKKVVEAIQDKCTLIFSGTESDKELISYISGDKFTNLAGKTGIKDMMELFRRSDIVLAPDSGSAHVARAVGIPAVISIFCCTPPAMYGPFGDDSKYFAIDGKLKCQPCHTRKCPLIGPDAEQCVNYPNPDEIINIVNNLLQNAQHSV